MKEKTFKLEPYEHLKIKKRGNYYYAYKRSQAYGRQEERYLGRCNPDGTPYIHTAPYAKYRGYGEKHDSRKQ